ncbi:MAG: uncharacterized protein PWQ08_972 [Clostridiales bacterium]|nr:uncharacterized protein [Clostridiales bacterium]
MDLKEYEPIIENVMKQLCENSRFPQTANYKQHGSLSVYEHSIDVARMSCRIASKLHFNVDYASLIRGALLHDYFLYDWHVRSKEHRLHAFSHPRKALQNACEDFELTPREKKYYSPAYVSVNAYTTILFGKLDCMCRGYILCAARNATVKCETT